MIQRPKIGVYPLFDLRYKRALAIANELELGVENPSITKTGRAFGVWDHLLEYADEYKERVDTLKKRFEQEFGTKAPTVKNINVACYGRGQEWTETRTRVYLHVDKDELLTGQQILEGLT